MCARPAAEFSVVDELPDSVKDLPMPKDRPHARRQTPSAKKGGHA
jgi:hypothetical protein